MSGARTTEAPGTPAAAGRGAGTVGAVVPCKDERATISRCLSALRRQEPPVSRIVVVDNGSTDGSLELARELADEVIEAPHATISELRNRGAAAVSGVEVIAFVDADTEVHQGWLRAGLDALDRGAALVGARTCASEDARWVATRWAAVEAARAHGASRVWSQHMLVRADLFAELGGFAQVPTGEDADLSIRMTAAGGLVQLVPEMVANHHGFPATLGAFLRRERWHTRARGWLPRMSRGSRALVFAGAGWAGVGAALGAAAVAGRPRALGWWAAASAVAVPALGGTTSRRPVVAAQDGVLLAVWTAVRVARLPRELRRRSTEER